MIISFPPCLQPSCNSSVAIFDDNGKFCPPSLPIIEDCPGTGRHFARGLFSADRRKNWPEGGEHPPVGGWEARPGSERGTKPISTLVRSRTLNRRRGEREISELEEPVGGGRSLSWSLLIFLISTDLRDLGDQCCQRRMSRPLVLTLALGQISLGEFCHFGLSRMSRTLNRLSLFTLATHPRMLVWDADASVDADAAVESDVDSNANADVDVDRDADARAASALPPSIANRTTSTERARRSSCQQDSSGKSALRETRTEKAGKVWDLSWNVKVPPICTSQSQRFCQQSAPMSRKNVDWKISIWHFSFVQRGIANQYWPSQCLQGCEDEGASTIVWKLWTQIVPSRFLSTICYFPPNLSLRIRNLLSLHSVARAQGFWGLKKPKLSNLAF